MTVKTFYLNERKTVTLKAYLLDEISGLAFTKARPAALIFPGGGYEFVSDREGEPIAMQFLAKGFNAFVLTYSCCKRHPQPLINAAWALANIRMRHKQYGIDPGKITVCGFSAGAHLAASIATMWKDSELCSYVNISPKLMRPDAAVLCYPVISGVTMPHVGSFEQLLGKNATREQLLKLSCEYRVTSETPPTFLWHTADDGCVPAQNSLVMAHACIKNNVPCELHIYDSGPHGLSDCYKTTAWDENHVRPHCGEWIDSAVEFLRKYLDI